MDDDELRLAQAFIRTAIRDWRTDGKIKPAAMWTRDGKVLFGIEPTTAFDGGFAIEIRFSKSWLNSKT